MRIAVLGSATSWYVGDLERAAGDAHEIVPVTYRDLAAQVDGGGVALASGEVDNLRLVRRVAGAFDAAGQLGAGHLSA